MRPAIQLYTLRNLDESLPDLLARVGDTAFEGVEFAGLGDSGPAAVAAALDDAGLDPAGAHVGVGDLEADLDAVVDEYAALGCRALVVPYLDEAAFADEAAARGTADRLTSLAERCADRGAAFSYHNHDHEFTDLGDRSGYDAFADAAGDALGFEVDVGWVRAAGYDPVALLDRLAGRVPLVHLKDVDAATLTPVELGEGDIDVEACAAAARDAGADWLVYEHDEPDDPASSLEHGADVLAGLTD